MWYFAVLNKGYFNVNWDRTVVWQPLLTDSRVEYKYVDYRVTRGYPSWGPFTSIQYCSYNAINAMASMLFILDHSIDCIVFQIYSHDACDFIPRRIFFVLGFWKIDLWPKRHFLAFVTNTWCQGLWECREREQAPLCGHRTTFPCLSIRCG